MTLNHTHVVGTDGNWYLVVFFENDRIYQIHGPMKKGPLDLLTSGTANHLDEAHNKAELWVNQVLLKK